MIVMRQLILIFLFLVFAASSSLWGMARKPTEKERISQGVYATTESINKGRIDTAQLFAEQTKELVTPPRKPVKVSEVKDSVILPQSLSGRKVVTINSAEYTSLLNDKKARKSLEISNKEFERFSKNAEKTLIEKDKAAESLKKENAAQKKKIADLKFYRNTVFSVIGLIVLVLAIWIISIVARAAAAMRF